MNAFTAALRIVPGPSRTLEIAVVALHALLMCLVIAAMRLTLPAAGLLCAVAASLWVSLNDLRGACGLVESLLLDSTGQWQVGIRGADPQSALLHREPFVSPWLTILCLRVADGRRFKFVFTPDSAPPDAFRRLRVRLRWLGERSGPQADAPGDPQLAQRR